MSSFPAVLLVSFLACELSSLVALQLGERAAESNAWLRRVGERLHRRKLRALDSVWPLTRLRPAAAREDVLSATGILAPLILLKSAVALPLGLVLLPWLPFASLLVPTMVMVHGPGDGDAMRSWALTVARLQLTSHAAAAAIGFAATLHGPLGGRSPGDLLRAHPAPIGALLAVSLLTGLAAAHREAEGLVARGYLDPDET